ncbi:hypothetical protein [Stakelama tenebrarum]|uniref:Uncharacterized protein n=1 Tax=Stakelama tenebrarum TaxID=2711215 RepID=A0A6G6Y5D6_9SPHN|nr:hypothetical protein [Sphingosinithalassobacter tenebrarum]QIG80061.1 hypothetical protein G5C33_09900 [Sphingosinithalassobacter tenebrarum]
MAAPRAQRSRWIVVQLVSGLAAAAGFAIFLAPGVFIDSFRFLTIPIASVLFVMQMKTGMRLLFGTRPGTAEVSKIAL